MSYGFARVRNILSPGIVRTRDLITKISRAFFAVLFFFVVIIPCRAQTPTPAQKRTRWVSPPLGSLIGGGYVDAGDTNKTSRLSTVTSADKASFKTALANFNAQADTVVEGWTLIVPAVAWQTGVPAETLKKQHAATGLSFGELLVANSLAAGSGKSLNQILALKGRTQGWGQLAKRLNINIDSVTARLRTASESIRFAESRRRKRREQNLRDTLNPGEAGPNGIHEQFGSGG
jgi:hypothetical protein